jgi:hypothetical protein
MLKHAIFFILDEDKHKKEELDLRRKAQEAIATFSADKGAQQRRDPSGTDAKPKADPAADPPIMPGS